VLGPVGAYIDEHLHGEQLRAQQTLLRQMRGKRYLALLAELENWHQRPALTEAAAVPAAEVRVYLDRAGRTLAKRLKQAARADAADELLHRARKAAKRARYTAELAKPAVGKPAGRIVKRATKLQDVLGEHQDAIVASDVLLHLGATAGAQPGHNGFTYGLLYAHEQHRAQATRERSRTLRWTA
jgi:CHAD domain-containing protein